MSQSARKNVTLYACGISNWVDLQQYFVSATNEHANPKKYKTGKKNVGLLGKYVSSYIFPLVFRSMFYWFY